MANATRAYVYFNLIGFKLSGIVLKRLEYSTSSLGCVCFYCHNLFSLNVLPDFFWLRRPGGGVLNLLYQIQVVFCLAPSFQVKSPLGAMQSAGINLLDLLILFSFR